MPKVGGHTIPPPSASTQRHLHLRWQTAARGAPLRPHRGDRTRTKPFLPAPGRNPHLACLRGNAGMGTGRTVRQGRHPRPAAVFHCNFGQFLSIEANCTWNRAFGTAAVRWSLQPWQCTTGAASASSPVPSSPTTWPVCWPTSSTSAPSHGPPCGPVPPVRSGRPRANASPTPPGPSTPSASATVMMIVEAQSSRQRHLAVRLLRYVVDRLLELCEDRERHDPAGGLPPVVVAVLYTGPERWRMSSGPWRTRSPTRS